MQQSDPLSRRMLLARAATGIAGIAGVVAFAGGAQRPAGAAQIPTIDFGTTGRTLPRLGFGAAPVSGLPMEQAVAVVRRALDAGIRYFDTAPSYGNGRSEERLGNAFAAAKVPREQLFIATKTLHRDSEGARRELEASLKRLQLDYVDSVQVHEVHGDWPRLFESHSVLSALQKARDEKLIRHIGITAHRDPHDAIEATAHFDFASALVPVNPLDHKHLSFIDRFLPVAAERKIAVVAMKIYASGHLVGGERPPFRAAELVRYALSQEHVAVCVPGFEKVEHVDAALEAMNPWQPMPAEEMRAMEQRAGEHRGKRSEWYKDEKR